jgi:hypothetical protein
MFKTNQPIFKVIWIFMCFACVNVFAQSDYRNFSEISTALKQIQSKHPSNTRLQSLTKTVGGHDIWALSLFKGKPENNPAIAIVGGVDGSHLLSTEMAVNIANNILNNHSEILEHTTFYIFPNMSPNASEQYFASLKYEAHGNAKKTDDDRDGEFDEDPFEDLNNDGLITLIRIEDVTGGYVKLKEDERIMVKANAQEGELGNYKVFSEGIDNDKDGAYNEDGKGGIHFNKNLTYNYPYFKPGAGEHPVSEKEHRALLDFLYEQWNIYAILTLGPTNNLSKPLDFNASNAKKRVVTSVLKEDASLNKFFSKEYSKITGTKDAPTAKGKGGGFFEWSYFHFGKLSMSTPGWWSPKFVGDSTVKAKKNIKANFLQWAEQENLSNYFVDWKEIKHPDFPNKKVEVGGIAPFKMTNPPYTEVSDISTKHTEFVLEITKLQPRISIENIITENVDNNLTRVTLSIHNKGFLPTHTAMGKRSRWLQKIKVDVELNNNQDIISGKKIQLINSFDGDKSMEFTWLIKGKGDVTIHAGSAHTGTDTSTINLK